jgi:NADH-quinone oxidoreductase subunit J
MEFIAAFWPVLVPVVLGWGAMYLLLPRVRRRPLWAGLLLGGIAILFAGVFLTRVAAALPETILFYAFSALAIVGGALLIAHHKPVYAALAFALVVLSTCGLFLLLAAPFLMAATVIIYAGAIIVTFLFLIMLAQQAGLSSADLRSREPFLACVAGFILLGAILCVLLRAYRTSPFDAASVDRMTRAAGARSEKEVREILGMEPADFFKQLRAQAITDPLHPDSGSAEAMAHWHAELVRAIDAAQEAASRQPLDLDGLAKAVRQVNAMVNNQGSLAPPAEVALSPFSGVPSNHASQGGAGGRPQERMPAENVASLGRSLFTDYLLPVELAGTLLLVATIGAIAIAARPPRPSLSPAGGGRGESDGGRRAEELR